MRQCIFMTIQLHLSHTIVECQNKFLNAAWQLQTTARRRLLGQRKGNFAFWPSQWRYSAANLGTVSFTHVKATRNKCLNLKIKITFLWKYPVCAINRATSFTFEWFNPVVP